MRERSFGSPLVSIYSECVRFTGYRFFLVDFSNRYASFQDELYLYLVLEYSIGGEFFTHLRKANRFPNDTAR